MILREKDITDFTAPNLGLTNMQPVDYGDEEVVKAIQLKFISGKSVKDVSKFFDLYSIVNRVQ